VEEQAHTETQQATGDRKPPQLSLVQLLQPAMPRPDMNRTSGFTLLELIVVLAGLGILASLAIPNYLKYLEDSKNDEAAAYMNSAAADCLLLYRSEKTTDKTPNFLERTTPPQGFNLSPDNNTCAFALIEPQNPGDTLISAIGFETRLRNGLTPYIYKIGSYSHPDGEAACQRWASFKEDQTGKVITSPSRVQACSEGADVQATRERIAAEAAERERLRQIELRFKSWLDGPPLATGNYKADGKDVWAFQGRVIPGGKAAFDKEVERECGKELVDALNKAKSNNHDGPYSYTGKSGACSVNTYLCSGSDVKDKDGYDACKEEERQTRCTAAEGRWKDSGVNDKFSEPGCDVKWQCNGSVFTNQNDYDKSTCGAPPPPPPAPKCIWALYGRPEWC